MAWIFAIVCSLVIVVVWAALTPKTIFKKEQKNNITFGQIFSEMKEKMSGYSAGDLKEILDKYNKEKDKKGKSENEYPAQPHLPLEK